MSKEHFIEIAQKFCALAGLSEASRLIEGDAVEIDGIDFYFGYNEEADPDYLVLYCDFGKPPKAQLLSAYQALLEMNMAVYGSHAPAFMLSPSKNVALAYHYHLDDVVPEQLVALFASLARQAAAWRTHHFLELAA